MNKLTFEKGIEQLRKISLTKDEKAKMLQNLSVYADLHMPVLTDYSLSSLFNFYNKKLSYAIVSILIITITGGTAAFASEYSLPGDLLYPVKTKIVEPVRLMLTFSPKSKAVLETRFAEERLEEAEKLSKKGKLTSEIKNELNKNFNSHLEEFVNIKKGIDKKSTKGTGDKDLIQENFDNKIKSKLNEARENLGLSPNEEDPHSVLSDKEKLEKLKNEQGDLEKQKDNK